jgi:hypothetical protein
MARLEISVNDPTLEAVDCAIEKAQSRVPRPYLGMSEIGHACDRKHWYSFHWSFELDFPADALKRFEDGRHGEDIQAARLRLVEGIDLQTFDPDTGRQFKFVDCSGHFSGHCDGMIHGLLQAPATWHIWEHKQTEEKKQAKLDKLKGGEGEKDALAKWDATYYAQAILYMHYSGLDRHYLTCATPGGRRTISTRTESDPVAALQLIARAERIIRSQVPPPKLHHDPDAKMAFECRYCAALGICHQGAWARRNCRTCLHAEAIVDGSLDARWYCHRHESDISLDDQRKGCDLHRFIPELVPGDQIDCDTEAEVVTYRLRDGSEWKDG